MTSQAFEYLGKTRHIFKRQDSPDALWYIRVRTGGRDCWVCLNTADSTAAVANARTTLLADLTGTDRFEEFRAKTRLRQPVIANTTTLGDIEKLYRSAARGRIADRTITHNIKALLNLHRRATGTRKAAPQISISTLDGDLVHEFKHAMLDECAPLSEIDRRRRLRTANSLIRQARSVFSGEMLSIYKRDHHITLPPDFHTFLSEPVFNDVSSTIDDYKLPPDHIISKTFAALETIATTDPNIHTAIWLALGFGLRKSEIAGVRARNFMTVQGKPHLELEEVWVQRHCNLVTKNGTARPRIPCTNGAWIHLEPRIRACQPDDYLLAGGCGERLEQTFRRVSQWMRELGWETQKAIHEFRAYAGCQVAMRDGIYKASKWLRHSTVSVTEKHYSRYVHTSVTDAAIEVRQVVVGQFNPQVVTAAAGSQAG